VVKMAMPIWSLDHEQGCACAACVETNIENSNVERSRGEAQTAGADGVAVDHDHSLVTDHLWDAASLTFSFPERSDLYGQGVTMSANYGTGEETDGFSALSGGQSAAAQFALSQFAAVSGLTFDCLEGDAAAMADIRFGQSSQPTTAWGYYPSEFEEGGDIWLGRGEGYYDDPEVGSYAWHTILHETGHALGLRHGHDAGALSAERDSMEYSVMTYRAFIGDPIVGGYSNAHGSYAQTLMQEDLAAAQEAYGANYDHMNGDTIYQWNPETGALTIDGETGAAPVTNTVFMTLWDGGGVDSFDFSSYRSDATFDLRAGAGSIGDDAQRAYLNADEPDAGDAIFASGSVFTAQLHEGDTRALIENALGGRGDDKIIGNEVGNRLEGGRGTDKLIGMQGKDKLLGAQGDDTLNGGGGRDIMNGGAHDDRLYGAGGRDKLNGGGGDDVLVGGAGDDKLIGGRGADVFAFANGDGNDRIMDFSAGEDLIDLTALDTTFEELTFATNHIAVEDLIIRADGVGEAGLTADDFLF
jgi:serralysin